MAAVQPAAPAAPEGEGQQQQGGIGQYVNMVARAGLMYAFMMWMRSGKSGESSVPLVGPDPAGTRNVVPYFRAGEPFNMNVYLSYAQQPQHKLLWNVEQVPLSESSYRRQLSVNLTADDLSEVALNNRTAHIVTEFVLSDPSRHKERIPQSFSYSIRATLMSSQHLVHALSYMNLNQLWQCRLTAMTSSGRQSHEHRILCGLFCSLRSLMWIGPQKRTSDRVNAALIKFRPPKKAREGRSLLGGEDDTPGTHADEPRPASLDGEVDLDTPEDDLPMLWVPYFKPNLTISMVNMFEKHNANRLAPNVAEALKVTHDDKYLPLIHLNDFWVLEDYMIPVNETTESLELHLELNTASNMYWMLISTFEIAIDTNRKNGMGRQIQEMEELKRVFLEGNPYFLFLTFVVSLLHSVFDMLAFKNDIGFWRSNKSMEGLSAKTIIINAFCQVIIFLYLLDNETSTVVLLSSGVGVLIEFWKITRVMDVSVEANPGQMPRLKIAHRSSYMKSETKKHDDDATKYMSYALFPMIICYFIYSLVYDKHKSWYSFILQSLVGCVYAFGFVLMCPQLYLNYKLKSVAHLPWRQMTYKFLNTIVDDLGAFIIKMPLLHRLAVFRDDVVFLIYIYQRWIYRVDVNRVNEFGFTGDEGQKAEELEGPQETSTPAIKDSTSSTSAVAASSTVPTQRRGKASEEPSSDPSPGEEDAKDK